MEKQEVKEYLKKQYPKLKGFIDHTLVAEMAMNFANMRLEAINYTHCCDKLKDLKDDNFDGYTLVDIKGGQIVIHKGEIYTMEFINEFNKMK